MFYINILAVIIDFFAGRKGVSIWQPLWDFLRLMKKEFVISTTTSWVFKFAPVVGFATTIFAALFVPMAGGISIVNVPCAFIIFAYSLSLGKFFALLSAMDTGSSFEGMGAAREASQQSLNLLSLLQWHLLLP